MGELTGDRSPTAPGRGRVLVAVLAGVVAFIGVAVAIWVLVGEDDDQSPATTSAAPSGVAGSVASTGVPAQVVTVPRLRRVVHESGRPVYWAGERPGSRIEYTQTPDGTTYVRYLTGSAAAGSRSGSFVVVATYAQPDALARVSQVARRSNLPVRQLPDGGIAVTKPGRPQNVYVVYPKVPYQVEVYAPSQATTERIVFGGRIRPVG